MFVRYINCQTPKIARPNFSLVHPTYASSKPRQSNIIGWKDDMAKILEPDIVSYLTLSHAASSCAPNNQQSKGIPCLHRLYNACDKDVRQHFCMARKIQGAWSRFHDAVILEPCAGESAPSTSTKNNVSFSPQSLPWSPGISLGAYTKYPENISDSVPLCPRKMVSFVSQS